MKINFLVHDCFPEIGHTRAMVEVFRKMDPKSIEKIRIICYSSAQADVLWPEHPEKIEIKIVPFKDIKPFLLKSLFFQLYTYVYKSSLLLPEAKTITMGVCSFIGDIVNIQFSHQIWEGLYFDFIPTSPIKKIYKKVLLRYLSLCEEIYYKKKDLHFVFLSKFMAETLTQYFKIPTSHYKIAYSSADIDTFGPKINSDRLTRINNLKKRYSELERLDTQKPTLLFVGAYERKGLPSIVDKVTADTNFIVIGKGEKGSLFKLPRRENIFHIEFTTEISDFFNISDAFIFPTSFEPFGLVVMEAYASGTKIFVSEDKVGATELIKNTAGVELITTHAQEIPGLNILEDKTRVNNYQDRLKVLTEFNWNNCSKQWQKVLTS